MSIVDRATLFKDTVDYLNDHGHDVEFIEAYSGRGMYGETTPAISGSISGVTLGVALAAVGYDTHDVHPIDLFCEEDFPYRADSLGLGSVFY